MPSLAHHRRVPSASKVVGLVGLLAAAGVLTLVTSRHLHSSAVSSTAAELPHLSLHWGRAPPAAGTVLAGSPAQWGAGSGQGLEIWAGGRSPALINGSAPLLQEQVRALLTPGEQDEIRQLCGRVLYSSAGRAITVHEMGAWTFVATGDINDMWLRDSSVQLGIYLPRLAARPGLRTMVEGGIRAQAYLILQDPYANAYKPAWKEASSETLQARQLGRGGWVATRNYELDSGAYFLHLLWNYWATPGLFAPDSLLLDPLVHDAAALLVKVWAQEQRHEEQSPYRYAELPRDGLGTPVGYTGMSWSGFRPSDDPNKYGYNVPGNMYAAAGLEKALHLNRALWRDPKFEVDASQLAEQMRAGIEKFGIVEATDDAGAPIRVYAYEVDGLGKALMDFDDPNVPSLLSIPLLGYRHFDQAVYEATRQRLLSKHNPYYFEGQELKGMGSPHTPHGYVWPLGIFVQALTSPLAEDRSHALRTALRLQCGNGQMHESVDVNNLSRCTRQWFEWANAMLVVLAEDALGIDCDAAAEEHRLATIAGREKAGRAGGVARLPNGGVDNPLYYEQLEAQVKHAAGQ